MAAVDPPEKDFRITSPKSASHIQDFPKDRHHSQSKTFRTRRKIHRNFNRQMKAEAFDRPVVTITVASMVVVYEAYHQRRRLFPFF